MVHLAAHLVQPGHRLLRPRHTAITRLRQSVRRRVQARRTGGNGRARHLRRRHQGAHLACGLRVRSGRSATLPRKRLAHARTRTVKLFRKLGGVWHTCQPPLARGLARGRKYGLLKQVAGLGAHLVNGRKPHARALVHVHVKRHGLKRARAHAAHVLHQVLARHGPRARRLHHEALRARACGALRQRSRSRQRHRERPAQPRGHGHAHGKAAALLARGGACRLVHGALRANHAHGTALWHGARRLAADHVTGRGVRLRTGRQKLRRVVLRAHLQKVAGAHGRVQAHVHLRHRHGAEAVAPTTPAAATHLRAAKVARRHHGAHQLAAVVRALVAHHVVVRAPVQVAVREVAVERPRQRAAARSLVRVGHLAAGGKVVQLRPVRADDGIHVVRRLHAALDLERAQAGSGQARQVVQRAEVLRAQRPARPGGGNHVAVAVHQLVRQAARLRAQPAVRAAPARKRAHHAHAGVAEAQRAVAKALQLNALARNALDLRNGKLARKRHALRTQLAAPARRASVVHVRLRRYVALDIGPQAPRLREQPPVLDDERVRAQKPCLAEKGEGARHLVALDYHVLRHVDAHAQQVRLAARLRKRLVREVSRAAARIEVASQAAEDRVRARGKRGPKRLWPPGGGQKLGYVVRVPKRQRGYTSLAQRRLPDCSTQPACKSSGSTL